MSTLSEIRQSRDTVQLIYRDKFGNNVAVKNYDGVLAQMILEVVAYVDKVNKMQRAEDEHAA